MQCPACGHANPPSRARFCGQCGAVLPRVCPSCRVENPASGNFCVSCGHSLTGPAIDPGSALLGERRDLSVLFCDLVDSTPIAGRLDPEDYRALVRRYQAVAVQAVQRRGGSIGNYLGDGLLVYFGYPAAREDSARRAVMAALDIVAGVTALGEPDLAVRIGLHYGLVVVGEMGAGEHRLLNDIVGETPNVAARIQALAGPNEVVLSGSTERLVRGYFDFEPMGARTLKGVDAPVEVFRAVSATPDAAPIDVAEERGLTPLAERDEELRRLGAMWEDVRAGAGWVALVRGEAGMGKSRLARVMRDRAVAEGQTVIELRCDEEHQSAIGAAPTGAQNGPPDGRRGGHSCTRPACGGRCWSKLNLRRHAGMRGRTGANPG